MCNVFVPTSFCNNPGFQCMFLQRVRIFISTKMKHSWLRQVLYFRTLSIVLYLSKTCSVYFSKHSVSETGFCLRLQVKPTQLGPMDKANFSLRRLKGCVVF
jgi:hypothetical protein